MIKLISVMAAVVLLGAFPAPAYPGSCQEKDGMLLCTDDVGRDSTLRSLDKALGSPAPFDPPTSYPDALKSFPSDIKSLDERRKGTSELRKDDLPQATVERPGVEKDRGK